MSERARKRHVTTDMSEAGRCRTAETVRKDEELVTEPSSRSNSPELEWLPSERDEAERSGGSS